MVTPGVDCLCKTYRDEAMTLVRKGSAYKKARLRDGGCI